MWHQQSDQSSVTSRVRSKRPMWSIAVAVFALSLLGGYGMGTYRQGGRIGRPNLPRAAADTVSKAGFAPNGDSASPIAEQASAPSDTQTAVAVVPPRVDTVYVDTGYYGETEDPDLIAGSPAGIQMLIPPQEPPSQLRPSDAHLIEWLHGQKLLVSRQLLRTLTWTIEPGEITEFQVVSDWIDPEQVSWGVRVNFIAQANGAGIRASGLLRYYGDGTEGSGYGFRDFLVEDIQRFGRW
jgi:hypothetical protein